MLLEVGFFPLMRVSHGIFCVIFLWVCCLFSCMWILVAYLFHIFYGLCGYSYMFLIKSFLTSGIKAMIFCYNPRSNLWEAWEDKREGKIYEFCMLFIVDLRFLGLLLWWDIKRFGHVKLLDKRVYLAILFKWGF